MYWIYDVPGGESHAGRALRRTTEILVALSGSFTVETTDATGQTTHIHAQPQLQGTAAASDDMAATVRFLYKRRSPCHSIGSL